MVYCKECGQRFEDEESYTGHLKQKHGIDISPEEIEKQVREQLKAEKAGENQVETELPPSPEQVQPAGKPPEEFVCGECGKPFGSKEALNSHVGKAHKPPSPPSEEVTVYEPIQIRAMNKVKKLLIERLPTVYGIGGKGEGVKLINAIIDTAGENPNILLNPQALHGHIKQFAGKADDRHLFTILGGIFSELQNEGLVGPQPQFAYPSPYGYGYQPAPAYTIPGYPNYLYGGYFPFAPPHPYLQPPQPTQPSRREILLEQEHEEWIQQSRGHHELEMKKLAEEIKNIAASRSVAAGGKEETLIPVEVGGKTFQVPVSMAPLYMRQEESPAVKDLRDRVEKQTDEIKTLSEKLHEKEIEGLKGMVSGLGKEIDELKGRPPPGSKTAMDVVSQGIDKLTGEAAQARQTLERVASGQRIFRPAVRYTPEQREQRVAEFERKVGAYGELREIEDKILAE